MTKSGWHGVSSHGYKSVVNSKPDTADRFYPVRVYDGEGNLKYELDSKQVRKIATENLDKGKNWRATQAPK